MKVERYARTKHHRKELRRRAWERLEYAIGDGLERWEPSIWKWLGWCCFVWSVVVLAYLAWWR